MNKYINNYRKIYFNNKWKRVIEVLGLILITSTIIYYAPIILYNDCIPEVEKQIEANFIRYKCNENEFNPLATFLFNPESTVIKAFLNK